MTILILLSFSVLAQDTIRTETLDSVVVLGEKEKAKQNDTDRLSAKELNAINANSVGDAAKFLSGTLVKDYGGLGGVKTISIRGLSANHTSITYDGVNIFDNQSGQIDLSKFSVSSVSNIFMANGQFSPTLPTASSLALANSINIETKKPDLIDKSTRGDISLSYGSFNTANLNIYLANRVNKKNIITLYGDLLNSDGRYPYVLNYGSAQNYQTEKLKRENNDIFSSHAEINWFHDIKRTNFLKLKAYYYYSNRGLPSNVTLYYNNSKQRLYNENCFLQSSYTSYLNGLFTYKNNAKFDWNFTEYIDPYVFNLQGKEDDRYTQKLIYDNNAFSFQSRENLFFTLTNDLYYNSLYASTIVLDEPKRLSSLTAFIVDWRFYNFALTSNVLHSFYADTYLDTTRQKGRFSPYFCLSYKKNNYSSSFFYKDIFRMPTFNELYYRYMGNVRLKPEQTTQFSWTNSYNLNFKSCNLLAEISFYHNKVKDKIVAIPKGNVFLWAMLNYGRVEIYGVDVRLDFSAILDKTKVYCKINYSYQHAADADEQSYTYKQILPYMPQNILSVIAQADWKSWNFGCSAMFVDKRYALVENIEQNLMKAYNDFGANVSYSISAKKVDYKLTLDVKNLLNTQYEIVKSYPMMGRNFNIKATIEF